MGEVWKVALGALLVAFLVIGFAKLSEAQAEGIFFDPVCSEKTVYLTMTENSWDHIPERTITSQEVALRFLQEEGFSTLGNPNYVPMKIDFFKHPDTDYIRYLVWNRAGCIFYAGDIDA